jgi:NADH-quinone oxidoreductase subunit J
MPVTPSTVAFYALALGVVACAAGVAFMRNILHAALALLGALVGVAGLYIYLGADFLGMTQLLVYVGGILVVLLFAILLTNRIGEVRLTNPSMGRGPAVILGLLAAAGLALVALRTAFPRTVAVATPTTLRLGDAFLREYLLLFELASVILLVALVGALVLARRAVRSSGVKAALPEPATAEGEPRS